MNRLKKRLARLEPPDLARLQRGIEKESLRTTPDGKLALTPHPVALGSALTHPHITTDFSESQPELITGVHSTPPDCLAELTEIHQFVYRNIGDELLWASSMPCGLPPDDQIPLGRYGKSNVARAKTVYRQGLSHRYGRRMQTISGIHYNFSLPESAWSALQQADGQGGSEQAFRTAVYFALIRNFRRHSWLPLYLFGASPALCGSFLNGQPHALQQLSPSTLYLPHATSLRMGPLGYQSEAQASLAVSYNCLDSYSASLSKALTEPYPPYERIGIHDGNGLYRQLATTLLQIENEFYGTIRPKRRIRSGERPLRALAERGVEYVEVRLIDLDPFVPIGITVEALRFLDVFLLHCLLSDSPPDTPDEIAAISWNQHRVAQQGRDPQLRLRRSDREMPLPQWGAELLDECAPIAAALDSAAGPAQGGAVYSEALAAARLRLDDPSATPSARLLRELRGYENSFPAFALDRSHEHRRVLLERPLSVEALARQQQLAADSLAEQAAIEASETMPFETYRQHYLAGTLPIGD